MTLEKKQPAKRGRPAKLSREQILKAALALLEKGPSEVTLNGVARALRVGPMSLYTHVENRDDLLQGVSGLVLEKLTLRLDADTWEGNVRLWVEQVQAHFIRYPQIVKLMGESQVIPVEWLRHEAQLAAVLQKAGLSAAGLSSTANLLSHALIFDCIQRSAREKMPANKPVPTEMSVLSDQEQSIVALLADNTPAGGHSLLDFVLEQLLDRARLQVSDDSESR